MADGLEFVRVLRVGLDSETGCEDELTDCGAETGEEGVEGLDLGGGGGVSFFCGKIVGGGKGF